MSSYLLEYKYTYNIRAIIRHDSWGFWQDNNLKFPAWYNVAKYVALIQPSSAFMERVFSILRVCIDERQEGCYSNRIAASTLLKYNNRKPGR